MFSKETHKAFCALEEIRRHNPVMPSASICCFLAIASDPGITNQDLEKAAEIGQSAASRHVSILSETRYDGKPGMNLVEQVYEGDGRQLRLYLTPKGQRLARRVEDILH